MSDPSASPEPETSAKTPVSAQPSSGKSSFPGDSSAAVPGDAGIGTTRWKRRQRIVERGVTLAAMAGVLWLGWSLIRGFSRMVEPLTPLPVAKAEMETAIAGPSTPLLATIEEPGVWQVAGWEWQSSLTSVASAELDKRLAMRTERVLATPAKDLEVAGDFAPWLALARQVGERVKTVSGGQVYERGTGPFRMRVVTRTEGEGEGGAETPAAMFIVVPGATGPGWSLLELTPREPAVMDPGTQLPWLEGDVEVARRLSGDGRVALALVEAKSSIDGLMRYWMGQGWEVTAGEGLVACVCRRAGAGAGAGGDGGDSDGVEWSVLGVRGSAPAGTLIVVRGESGSGR